MRTIDRAATTLLLIDVQARLVPAIPTMPALLAECRRLLDAARLLEIPLVVTEQNPEGLGPTAPGLLPPGTPTFLKQSFDACRTHGFEYALGPRPAVVVAGCETHVCVLQTTLGLLEAGRRVYLVADAVASRTTANRDAAIARMAAHGAEIVTAEMVIFEWLETAQHPSFREAVALVK